MLYLVVNEDTINQSGNINSSRFPRLVDAPSGTTAEDIVKMSFPGSKWNPRPPKSYLVIPMSSAKVVEFKPREDYIVETRFFEETRGL